MAKRSFPDLFCDVSQPCKAVCRQLQMSAGHGLSSSSESSDGEPESRSLSAHAMHTAEELCINEAWREYKQKNYCASEDEDSDERENVACDVIVKHAWRRPRAQFVVSARKCLENLQVSEHKLRASDLVSIVDTEHHVSSEDIKAFERFLKHYKTTLRTTPLFHVELQPNRPFPNVYVRAAGPYHGSSSVVPGYLQFIGQCNCSLHNLPRTILMWMRSEHWNAAMPYQNPSSIEFQTKAKNSREQDNWEEVRKKAVEAPTIWFMGPYSIDAIWDREGFSLRQSYLQQADAHKMRPPVKKEHTPVAPLTARVLYPFGSCRAECPQRSNMAHKETVYKLKEHLDKDTAVYHGGTNFIRGTNFDKVDNVPASFFGIQHEFWTCMDESTKQCDTTDHPGKHTKQYMLGVNGVPNSLYVHLNGYALEEHVTQQAPNQGIRMSKGKDTSGRRRSRSQYTNNSTETDCKRFQPMLQPKGEYVCVPSYPCMVHQSQQTETGDIDPLGGNDSILPTYLVGLKRAKCLSSKDGKIRKLYVGMAASPMAMWMEPSYHCYLKHWLCYLEHLEATLMEAADALHKNADFDVLEHVASQGYYDPLDLEAQCSPWGLEKGVNHCVMGFVSSVGATDRLKVKEAGYCTSFGVPEPPSIMLHKLALLIEVIERVELHCMQNKMDMTLWPITPAIDMVRSYECTLKAASVHLNHKDTFALFQFYNAAGWPNELEHAAAVDTKEFWHPVPVHTMNEVQFERLMQLWQIAANHMAAIEMVAHAKSKEIEGSLYERHASTEYFTTVYATDTAGVAAAHAKLIATEQLRKASSGLPQMHYQNPRLWNTKHQLRTIAGMHFSDILQVHEHECNSSKDDQSKQTLIQHLFAAGLQAKATAKAHQDTFIESKCVELDEAVKLFLNGEGGD